MPHPLYTFNFFLRYNQFAPKKIHNIEMDNPIYSNDGEYDYNETDDITVKVSIEEEGRVFANTREIFYHLNVFSLSFTRVSDESLNPTSYFFLILPHYLLTFQKSHLSDAYAGENLYDADEYDDDENDNYDTDDFDPYNEKTKLVDI